MGRRVCVGSRLDVSGRSGRSCERERQVVRVCGRRGEGLSSQNTCENMRVRELATTLSVVVQLSCVVFRKFLFVL